MKDVSSQQLTGQFMRVIATVKSAMHVLAESHKITPQQMGVMYILHTQGTMVMGSLADQLRCDASNITGIIERLVQQGLVARTPLQEDKRAKCLALTGRGQYVIESIVSEAPHLTGFDRLTPQERQVFSELLDKLRVA